ncbi:MAG: hypothetical protein HY650_07685 [Acidobacteria bacterium]|nr:hypothetical protein [Acidobacteriota bacterium]
MQLAHRELTGRTMIRLGAVVILLMAMGYFSYRAIRSRSEWESPVASATEASPAPPFSYTGSGSCSSTACHGGVTARTANRVPQNEFSTWVLKDKHARAYTVLLDKRAVQIARNMGIDRAERSRRCLGCHALNVAPELQTRSFAIADGVGCESCHGPAEGWLSEHTRKDWSHEASVKRGMHDLRDLVSRAEKCSSCHLGDAENEVDHQLIAAGHPDLFFELDTFTALMPAHWEEESWKNASERDPWFATRAWATSQAVSLRDFMRLVAGRSQDQSWPEFSHYECNACHHDLTMPSWRQIRGYTGFAGRPNWNPSRYLVLRHMVRLISPEEAIALDREIAGVGELLVNSASDQASIAVAARLVADRADRLASMLAHAPVDQQVTLALIRSISADGHELARGGLRSVEQAAMTLESLYDNYARAVKGTNQQAIKDAIRSLFDDLEKPRSFEPSRLADRIQQVGRLLG